LIVHSELLYINEDVGPTIDLLCNTNIFPNTTTTRPIRLTALPIDLNFKEFSPLWTIILEV